MVFVLAPATIVLMMMVLVAVAVQETARRRRKQQKQQYFQQASPTTKSSDDLEIGTLTPPPGPTPIPFFGNLLSLRKYSECPYQGFCELKEKYGPVYALKMGNNPTVVVNTFDTIKEVLVNKANSFDARPDLLRFKLYFGGDRQHSLALCDWNEHQKRRMTLTRSFLMFRGQENNFAKYESNVVSEMPTLINEVDKSLGSPMPAKELLSYCALNIFSGYMCSKKFQYEQEDFQQVAQNFDYIFRDINNGHAMDFLPSLQPLFTSYINEIKSNVSSIRQYILDNICLEKYERLRQDPSDVEDLVDACFANLLTTNEDEKWDWQTILYIVEDLLGGSMAISNIVMRLLAHILQNPHVMDALRAEIDEKIGRERTPTLQDRHEMLYSQAVLYEVLRVTSSPVVPHVATEDSSVGGYAVKKGSIVFLNNFEMNSSPNLWDQPDKFMPERFLKDGCIKKPEYFIPFSTGKRSCVGSKMVANTAFMVVTTLLQRYNIAMADQATPDLPQGKISLDWNPFQLVFTPRE
ncbi:hypothetical protein O3P69_006965 [Scylla paramamosain]|uniref:Cytochrome P450 n=1 Tax=Scylla paramamosain TaxID=85552 RepID=A0AAW0V3M2_SCYPA